MRTKKMLTILTVLLVTLSCNNENEANTTELRNVDITSNAEPIGISHVVGLGKIEPETKILSLASASSGIITGILKNNGDRVKEGETIIVLDSETETTNLQLIRDRIRTQENQVEFDKQSVREAEFRLENKTKLLESSRRLLERGAETGQNLYDIETDVRILGTGLLKAKAGLAISESRLNELRTEFRKAQTELNRRNLTAPADGIVLNVTVTTGSSISQYSEFCEFAPEGKKIARCEIDEMFADRISEGQSAEISLVGNREIIATGQVIRAAPYLKRKSLFSELPGDMEDRRVREIWILLNDDNSLLFNMQVECKIIIR